MLERLTASLEFQGKALQLRSQRQAVLASNIANADTPGYVARDFDFARELAARTAKGAAPSGLSTPLAMSLTASAAGHLSADGRPATSTSASSAGTGNAVQLQYRRPEQAALDRNTVDLDRERANFADNAVRYESTLRFINSSVRSMISAIRGE
jgi:flagellar basal-body rod protein FlgB